MLLLANLLFRISTSLHMEKLKGSFRSSPYRIAHLNVPSLEKKEPALNYLLQRLRIGVLAITETLQTDDDIRTNFNFDDYIVAATSSLSLGPARGGVAIYVHKDISRFPDEKIMKELKYFENKLDITAVTIAPTNEMDLLLNIYGVYISPAHKYSTKLLNDLEAQFTAPKTPALILGDFNPAHQRRIQIWEEWKQHTNLWLLNDDTLPTYYTGSCTDYVLYHTGDNSCYHLLLQDEPEDPGGQYKLFPAETLPAFAIQENGHYPIALLLQSHDEKRLSKHAFKVRNTTDDDWEIMNNDTSKLLKEYDIDKVTEARPYTSNDTYTLLSKLEKIYTRILTRTDLLCAEKDNEVRMRKNKPEDSAKKNTHSATKQKRRKTEPTTMGKTQVQTDMKKQTLETEESRTSWRTFPTQAKVDSLPTFYKFLAKLDGRRNFTHKYSCASPIEQITPDGNVKILTNPKDKATAIQRHLYKKFNPQKLNETEHKRTKPNALEALKTDGSTEPPLQEFEMFELVEALNEVNKYKAPGHDNIPMFTILRLRCAHNALLALYNAILHQHHVPASMEVAIIYPLDKPGGNPRDVKNKRPVSLITAFGKILERMLFNRVYTAPSTCILMLRNMPIRGDYPPTRQYLTSR